MRSQLLRIALGLQLAAGTKRHQGRQAVPIILQTSSQERPARWESRPPFADEALRLRRAVACPRSHSEEEQGLSRGYLRVKSPHGVGKVMEPTQRSSRAVGRLAKQSFRTIPVFSEGAPKVCVEFS